MRTSENMLILPSLYIIRNNPNINASALNKQLESLFKPTGEDAKILDGRNDTKFSQIARNLKSHRESNGMKKWTNYDRGSYTITEEGEIYLSENIKAIQYLFNNDFSYEDVQAVIDKALNKSTKRKLYIYDENELVAEGVATRKPTIARKRSARLRQAAILKYTNKNGHIYCAACGFDYWDFYGDLGKNRISIHHEKPLFQYDNENFEEYIGEAVKRLKPLCANCHQIVHADRRTVLSVDELKSIIENKTK